MPGETQKTDDSFEAVITHPGGQTEDVGQTEPVHPGDTITGLVVLLLVGYIIYKLVRR